VRIVNELEARSVGFESVMEHIETTSPSGKLVFHLFAALAEFERNVTRERTLAGLRSARARGRKGGRPKKLTRKEGLDMLRALVKEGITPVKDIAVRFGVSRATVYRLAPKNGKPWQANLSRTTNFKNHNALNHWRINGKQKEKSYNFFRLVRWPHQIKSLDWAVRKASLVERTSQHIVNQVLECLMSVLEEWLVLKW
jgi:hypothetical protein